jgi:hypothetical protein
MPKILRLVHIDSRSTREIRAPVSEHRTKDELDIQQPNRDRRQQGKISNSVIECRPLALNEVVSSTQDCDYDCRGEERLPKCRAGAGDERWEKK